MEADAEDGPDLDVHAIFDELDSNHNGRLETNELRVRTWCLQRSPVTDTTKEVSKAICMCSPLSFASDAQLSN